MSSVNSTGPSLLRKFLNLSLSDQIFLFGRFLRGLWLGRNFNTKGMINAGRRVKVVRRNGEIHLNQFCTINEDVNLIVIGSHAERKAILRIGYGTYIGPRSRINVTEAVVIGDDCMIT
jgi:hypothetical protein